MQLLIYYKIMVVIAGAGCSSDTKYGMNQEKVPVDFTSLWVLMSIRYTHIY